MKIVVNIAKVLVGVLFIVSGLVKANDPLGLSYKMQEFFDVWTSDLTGSHFILKNALIGLFTFLNAHSLALSISMIVLEIMAGIALLIGWHRKLVTTLLLVLIVFFTFLTGYAYASGKFKNCGCFGDCLPITPAASFIKDLILLGLIVFLFFARRFIQPVLPARSQAVTLSLSLLLSIGIQWYVLTYLPFADCLPFKKGANIATEMKPPPHAIPDSFAIQFVYEKDGKRYKFFPESLPADLGTYKFVERKDELIRKGNADPAIHGFALSGNSNVDSTTYVLQQPYAVLYFYENDKGMPAAVKTNLMQLYNEAHGKSIPVYVITTSLNSIQQGFDKGSLPGLQFFKVDFTAFRTAARTNPCIYLLQAATIKEKESQHRTATIINAMHTLK